MSGQSQTSYYIHGHHPSVIKAHAWRTADNSSPHLLPFLKQTNSILDIGCGPGSITVDLAARVPKGFVTGIDASSSVIEMACAHAKELKVSNVSFAVGDIYALRFSDESFDVVHAHQVLQHIDDPISALKEMRRVCKKGGIISCREADLPATIFYPYNPGLQETMDLYLKVGKSNGGQSDTGRKLHALARQAGFERKDITASAGTWCFSTQDEREFWGGVWAERLLYSDLRKHIIDGGHANEHDVQRLVDSWMKFIEEVDGWLVVVHGEIICRKE